MVSTASAEFRDLVDAPSSRLRALMQRGVTPGAELLVGREFRGALMPKLAQLIGMRRFIKGFQRDEDSGAISGYNVAVKGADPVRAIRDYLVSLEGSDLLLGHAFVAAGSMRLPVGFFVLEPTDDGP